MTGRHCAHCSIAFAMALMLFAIVSDESVAAPPQQPLQQPTQSTASPVQRRSAKAEPMRGPFPTTQAICASLRKAACKLTSEYFAWSDEPELRATCVGIEVPMEGSLRPPYLEVRGFRAACGGSDGGNHAGQVRLAVRLEDGWYLGPQLEELEDRKVTESTQLRAVSVQGIDGAALLAASLRRRCTLLPAKLSQGPHELTMDSEQLVVIGSGPSRRPSALTYDLGSSLSLRALPDLSGDPEEGGTPRKQRRQAGPQTVFDDTINIGWRILPGPALQLDEPQPAQSVKPSVVIPDDIPCAESAHTLEQRLKRARRLAGVYPLVFR